MNKKEFTEFIAFSEDINCTDAEKMINTVLKGIQNALAIGESIKLIDFGIFEVKERAAHIGRNPRDPEKQIEIPAHKIVSFKAGKGLREMINRK